MQADSEAEVNTDLIPAAPDLNEKNKKMLFYSFCMVSWSSIIPGFGFSPEDWMDRKEEKKNSKQEVGVWLILSACLFFVICLTSLE